MHDDAREPQAWTRSIEPLFRPGDGTTEGTKRSCELIYRAWTPLSKLAAAGNKDARRVQEAFLGEFENVILAGKRGEDAQRIARQFCDSFIDVPAGEFHMGSPPEKQEMPEDLQKQWQEYLDQKGEPEERAAARISSWTFSPGKQGQEWRDWELKWWTNVFRDKDLEAIVRRLYTSDETPKEPIQQVDRFCLSRWPTINAWYRLFDPSHGTNESWYREVYSRISPDTDMPAIFVTWYDAWVFCLWARWQGASCRLPREYEWEYAAKAGTPWDQNYRWGDEFDPGKCNGDQNVGRTTAPTAEHANPWGLVDILGNVVEWCQDEYQRAYSRDKADDPFGSSARVLRGGSWDNNAARLRSAYRNINHPANTDNNVGLRVAKALSRRDRSRVSAPRRSLPPPGDVQHQHGWPSMIAATTQLVCVERCSLRGTLDGLSRRRFDAVEKETPSYPDEPGGAEERAREGAKLVVNMAPRWPQDKPAAAAPAAGLCRGPRDRAGTPRSTDQLDRARLACEQLPLGPTAERRSASGRGFSRRYATYSDSCDCPPWVKTHGYDQ